MHCGAGAGWLTKTIVAPIAVFLTVTVIGSARSAPPPPNMLKIEWATDIDYVDPALSYFAPTWQLHYSSCAKLVNYPDRAAPEGNVLQPEVASAMPTISPDGRTYTFQVRDDFVFSPPSNEQVTAEHFEWAIERLQNPQMNSPARPFVQDVQSVLASGDTLTFTLLEPAGDFLTRLAMPFFCPLPLSTPVDPNGIGAPLPAAGPYYIEQWQRPAMGQPGSIVVKENPNYTGNRPHRFDEFQIATQIPQATIKTNIESGDTDTGDIAPEAHADAAARCGAGSPAASLGRQCYFVYPSPTVLYLGMNHDRPLFGDDPSNGPGVDPLGNVALKKAVNFAIDRTFMMQRRGAFAGVPTDQHLPHGIPGFRDADIYPSSPDLDAARELAGCTGSTPDTCPARTGVLYCSNVPVAVDTCLNVRGQLLQIGLDMTVMNFPRAQQFERTGTRGEPFDMTLEGWREDFHDPFNFMFLLDGERLGPVGSTKNVNFAYFDDPAFNAAIDAAQVLPPGDERFDAFGDLDVETARDKAPWAPYLVPNDRLYFSDRIGCQTYVPAFMISFGALCVRPLISIGDAAVTEGNSGTTIASFTVSIAEGAPADYPFTVDFTTVDGTATGSDYQPRTGSITFTGGQTRRTIFVNVNGDTRDEPNETFFVQLSNPTKGTIMRSRGTGTINDNDVRRPVADLDGDNDTEPSVWRPSNGTWYSSSGVTEPWGVSSDVPVPGQYDADAATDVAVWRPADGFWYVKGGPTQQWGVSTDVPVPCDYDGDGDTDFGIWRPGDGTWYVPGLPPVQWGVSGDVPVPADYDGDGRCDFAVWRPATGTWYVHGGATQDWGVSTDVPTPADYDNDGAAEFAVWRPESGTWYVHGGGTQQWGVSTDVPVAGDYDGDGDADFAVWRPATGFWYVQGGATQQWGVSSDKPLPPLPSVMRLLFA